MFTNGFYMTLQVCKLLLTLYHIPLSITPRRQFQFM